MKRDSKRNGQRRKAPRSIERRTFLKLGGLAFPAVAGLPGCAPERGERTGQSVLASLDLPTDYEVTVLRKEDMVALRFGFVNLRPVSGATALGRIEAASPAYVVVSHEPQHVAERAYAEDANNSDPPPAQGPIPTRIARRSRVAYRVPDSVDTIQLSVEDLLASARDYELSVGRNATPPSAPSRFLVGVDGFALSPLVTSQFQTTLRAADSTTTTPVRSIGVIRATRGLRALQQATGLDVGFPTLGTVTGQITLLPLEPEEPGSTETSLELPFRLEISPNRYGQWAHATSPVDHNGRVELWHSRLAVRGPDGPNESSSYLNTIRALWARDDLMTSATDPKTISPCDSLDPFRTTLSPSHRVRLVHQSSNFSLLDSDFQPVDPAAVTVNRLMLTALGGTCDLNGDWGDNPICGIALWQHRATLGRDHYVKVVETGYLYPFGHRASLITISERKLDSTPHEAFVRQRRFILVKEPVLDFTKGRDVDGVRKPLRKFPFTMVHIKTTTTPNLDMPDPDPNSTSCVDEGAGGSDDASNDIVKIEVGSTPFRFECEALDSEGRLVSFTAPMVWVFGNENQPVDSTKFTAADDAYQSWGSPRESNFAGQRLAFAPANQPDDTTYETYAMQFGAKSIDTTTADASGYQACFVPKIQEVELAVDALREAAGASRTLRFQYHDRFRDYGFDPPNGDLGNAGEILFGLTSSETALSVNFSKASDSSGGFLAPNFSTSGLSRKTGPVAGNLDSLASDSFSALDFFSGMNAKLFGVIDLFEIIDSTGLAAGDAPKFMSQSLDVVEGFVQDAQALSSDLASLSGGGAASLATSLDNAVTALGQGNADAISSDLATSLTDFANATDVTGSNKGLVTDAQRQALSLASVIGEISTSDVTDYLNAAEMALSNRVKMEWRPPLKPFPAGDPLFDPQLPDGTAGSLVLSAEIRGTASPGKAAGTDLVCSLDNFTLYVLSKSTALVTVPFNHLQFSMLAGQPSDVEVELGTIEFGGVLDFIESIKDAIPLDGFSSGAITVSDTGIESSMGISLPSLAIGMFSLQNVSLSAGFSIPFVGDAISLSFDFCTRENPFLLTVCMVGGGGFVGLTVDPSGIRKLEAQFEAGAELAMDFGVAGGSVSVMVGVYFMMEGDDATVTAFFQIHGEVDVLGGLISASLTLELDMTYESSTNKLVGSASMEIEVSVLFFSGTVTVSFEQKLAGSNGDPSFADKMAPSLPTQPAYTPWDDYVLAFAA